MSNPAYSIFIPTVQKDFNKLNFLLESVRKNLKGYNEIILVSPKGDTAPYISIENLKNISNIKHLKDREVLDIDPSTCNYRPNWQYQQFLKMFQNVTENDMYLTIDSDVVILKPIDVFENNKPCLFMGWEQNHRPYFEFQEKLFDLPRVYPHTGICDMNFFDKNVWKEFLNRYNYSPETLWQKTCEITSHIQRIGEPEVWIQYIHKFHSEKYFFKQLNSTHEGKSVNDLSQRVWSDAEYKSKIEKGKRMGIDLIALHSWYG